MGCPGGGGGIPYIMKGGWPPCGGPGGEPFFLDFLPLPVNVPDFMGGGTPFPALGGPWPFIIDLGTPIRLPEEECFLDGGVTPLRMEPFPMYIIPGGALESRASRLFERFFFFLSFLTCIISSSFSSGMGGGGGDEGMSICRGRFLCEVPETVLRKDLKVEP